MSLGLSHCTGAPAAYNSDGKDVGEEAGKAAEEDEPDPHCDQNPSAPGLDRGGAVLDGVDEVFPGGGEQYGEREHEGDDGQAGYQKAECGGVGASGGEGLTGQTGQNRPGSAEPGEEVDEPEEHEPGERTCAA